MVLAQLLPVLKVIKDYFSITNPVFSKRFHSCYLTNFDTEITFCIHFQKFALKIPKTPEKVDPSKLWFLVIVRLSTQKQQAWLSVFLCSVFPN